MAGTIHHRLPLFLLIAFPLICSYAYSDIPHPPTAHPPFHHNDKPFPGHNPSLLLNPPTAHPTFHHNDKPFPWHTPSLTPHSHDKPSPIPIRKPPRHHMKPPTSRPHPLDFAHPSSLISKAHPPLLGIHQPVHDGRHPSPPGKPQYPIKPPSRSPHFYKSPPPYIRHGAIHTAPPPIHH